MSSLFHHVLSHLLSCTFDNLYAMSIHFAIADTISLVTLCGAVNACQPPRWNDVLVYLSIYARYSVVLSIETVNSFARRHQFEQKIASHSDCEKQTHSNRLYLFLTLLVALLFEWTMSSAVKWKSDFLLFDVCGCVCVCKLSFLLFSICWFFFHVPEMHEQRKVMIRMISIWMGDCIKKICLPHSTPSQQ